MDRHEQFAIIESTKTDVMAWAGREGIPLHEIEHVVPFVEGDISLSVWFFFERKSQVSAFARSGVWDRLASHYRAVLAKSGYPDDWLSAISFLFDSDENVQANYEGSYFYRLR